MTFKLLLILTTAFPALAELPRWEFESDSQLQQWVPNSHLSNVTVKDGVLRAQTTDWDPFFLCRNVTIKANPCQYIVIRLKANRPGIAELFWSGSLEGQYGGLTENKKIRFSVDGGDSWQEIVIFPFWHTEGVVRQLRLDLYEGSLFEIDWIRIQQWGANQPQTNLCSWNFGGDTSPWQIHPESPDLFAPPQKIAAADKTWVTVQLESDREDVGSILWAREDAPGLQSREFALKGDGRMHSYNLKMTDAPGWRGNIMAFGIRLPRNAAVRLESISMGNKPSGPGELDVVYFGFENAINRTGRPCRLLAQIINRGGAAQGIRDIHLTLPSRLKLVSQPEKLSHQGLEHGEIARFTWEVNAPKAGTYDIGLSFSGKGNIPPDRKASLQFTESLNLPKAQYVPEPRPIETDIDVCAYYFPGWGAPAKWDCVRDVAPVRKPLLGYYDESNPQCVDWQIKWARENGISCFLVDWYWVQGRQQLTHWFEAYRKAKYRDSLKVAIMWANHNPPRTHSVEDLLDVTRHWVQNYFPMKSYYRIHGKPAVFIWNPTGIRSDLGGSKTVRETLDKCQVIARDAGYEGITFIALNSGFSASHIDALLEEGYTGVTTYHEWGRTVDGSVSQKLFDYRDVVRNSESAWQEKNKVARSLDYYPLVDTGWDSRPWHGDKSLVIRGRSPQLFEQLLRQAKSFCRENDKPMVILGPVNEWGEGSYIEPCTEFGFEMLEAIRTVFAEGNPATWPANISPSDVGLGPYDFPQDPAANN